MCLAKIALLAATNMRNYNVKKCNCNTVEI